MMFYMVLWSFWIQNIWRSFNNKCDENSIPKSLQHFPRKKKCQVHVLEEFGMPNIEDWLFVCHPKTRPWPLPLRRRMQLASGGCAALRQWGAEVNRLCHESKFGPVDWEEFQGRLRPMLLEMLGDAVEYHIHKPGVAGENWRNLKLLSFACCWMSMDVDGCTGRGVLFWVFGRKSWHYSLFGAHGKEKGSAQRFFLFDASPGSTGSYHEIPVHVQTKHTDVHRSWCGKGPEVLWNFSWMDVEGFQHH